MAGIEQHESRNGAFWGEFLSASVYKRNQGKVARQVTFAALALTVGLGVWRLSQLLPLWFAPGQALAGGALAGGGGSPGGGFGDAFLNGGGFGDVGVVRFLVPALLLAAGLWFCFRLVNVPRFADFLIAVEAEMAKVSWPTGGEVVRSSAVVIFVIFALAAILAMYDLFWWFVLRYVLRIT
jgi:preprotein translocase subunit SecE